MPETTEQTEQAEKGWLQTKYSQEEVGYTDYAVRRNPVNSVCQTCRWFINRDFSMDGASNCHIVECYPLDIVGTGYCNQWTARKIVEPEPMAVVLVEESDDMDSEELEVGTMARKPGRIERAKAAITSVLAAARRGEKSDENAVFKALGDGWWMAAHTNNFEDKDNEILDLASHKRFVMRAMAGYVDMPELWMGHIGGTAHGKAKLLDVITDNETYAVTVALGQFDKTEFARDAEKEYLSRGAKAYTLSHAFLYPKWAKKSVEIDGRTVTVYSDYNTFEISVLLPGQEANPYTSFRALEEISDMALTEDRKALIRDLMGKNADKHMPTIERFYDEKEAHAKALAEMGIRHKEWVDLASGAANDTAEKASGAATGELLADVLSFQGDTTKALIGLEGKALAIEKAATAEMTALKARVAQLEALLETTKHAAPASEAAGTVVAPALDLSKLTPEMIAALPTEIKVAFEAIAAKQGDGQEYDPFFGDLKVKRSGR